MLFVAASLARFICAANDCLRSEMLWSSRRVRQVLGSALIDFHFPSHWIWRKFIFIDGSESITVKEE